MSQHLFEDPRPDGLEKALRSLAPLPPALNRDRIMYQAGRRTRGRQAWLWVGLAGVLGLAALLEGIILARGPGQAEIKYVYLPAPAPAPVVPNNPVPPVEEKPVPPPPYAVVPNPAPEEPPPYLAEEEPEPRPNLAYYHVRKHALDFGVNSLPLPSLPGPMNSPPLPRVRGNSGLNNPW